MLSQSRGVPALQATPVPPNPPSGTSGTMGHPRGDIGHQPTQASPACRTEGTGLGETPEGEPGAVLVPRGQGRDTGGGGTAGPRTNPTRWCQQPAHGPGHPHPAGGGHGPHCPCCQAGDTVLTVSAAKRGTLSPLLGGGRRRHCPCYKGGTLSPLSLLPGGTLSLLQGRDTVPCARGSAWTWGCPGPPGSAAPEHWSLLGAPNRTGNPPQQGQHMVHGAAATPDPRRGWAGTPPAPPGPVPAPCTSERRLH